MQGSSEEGACYYIMKDTYSVLKTVSAHKGYVSDQHEFLLTPEGTALFFGTKVLPMDLSEYGGPTDGYIQDYTVQEVFVCRKKSSLSLLETWR